MTTRLGHMSQVLTTACPLDCPDSCSLSVTIDEGRIVKIDADTGPSANPFTQGYICQKVKHQAERVYAPERVLRPLIRSGPKGSGEFREATWDEAIELVAARIRSGIDEHGGRSVVPYLYNSSAGVFARGGLTPILFEMLGCPDVEHTICAATVSAAWQQVYGSMLSADPFDLAHSKLIVVWGANPNASNTHLTPLITKAIKDNGAKLVVIDPRRTGVAGRADMHLAIRPGTDVVLAYALARWLADNGHVAGQFLADHTVGSEAFLDAAREWTLERAADVCGLDAASIEELAGMVAHVSPAMLRLGWGLERNRNGGSGCVGAISLWAVAGHFGERGSGIIKSTSGTAPLSSGKAWPAGVERPPRTTMSMNDVGRALNGELDATPPTRVLFVQGANPAVTAMDQSAFIRGLQGDGVFTVVHDQVLTDTAVFADVVLPATTHFEADDLVNSYGSFSLLRVEAVIDRVGESRTNDEVAAALARALGLPAAHFDPTPQRMADVMRSDSGNDSLPAIRLPGATLQFVDSFPSFADGTSRARLADPSSELPLPRFVRSSTAGLVMLSPSTNRTINSMFAEFDPPDVVVSINPVDAASRDVVDGSRVRVFNELGSIEIDARLDPAMREGVVSIPKGLWRRHFTGGLTANALIPRVENDLGSGACFNDARVEVEMIRS